MYKSTSENTQSRAVRAVLNTTKNEGLDPSVFDDARDVERTKDNLRAQVSTIEGRIAVLNAHIDRADLVRREGGGATPAKTYGGWKIERARLVVERAAIAGKLSELKHYGRVGREERLKQFDTVFVDMAREMLAADVFERLQIATIHRLTERVSADAAGGSA